MSPANCLAGYKALASRGMPSLKLYASAFTIRPEPGHLREIHHSNKVDVQLPRAGTRSLSSPRSLALQQHVFQVTAISRYATHAAAEPRDDAAELPTSPPFSSGKYENLTIGIP